MDDLKVSPGYSSIEGEFEASLRRAFVDKEADYVVIYSRRQRFQIEAAGFAIEKGWLEEEFVELDEQSSEFRYSLTEKGKEHFAPDFKIKEVVERFDRR